MAKGSKNDKKCYTCRYWEGCSVKVVSPNFIEYNQSERATCNQTGHDRPAWASCNQHERSYKF